MTNLREWHEKSKRIERMLSLLQLMAADALLYKDDHPKFQATLERVKNAINQTIANINHIELKIVQNDLIYDNLPLQNHLMTTETFRQSMLERGIESLIFTPGITGEELLEYAHFMRLSFTELRRIGNLSKYFRDKGLTHIRIARLVDMRMTGASENFVGLPMLLKNLHNFRKENLHIIEDMHKEARVARVLDIDAAQYIVEQCLSQSAESSVTLLALNAVRSADSYTSTHSLNTCILSICFARYLRLDEELLPKIGVACLLHDIGKMFIPEKILNKPGKLSPEEWTIMENHTTLGARFLLGIPDVPPIAPLVAFEHHMQFDKSGYPRVQDGYDVNIVSMITTLSDFYDALTTTRPYKRAVPPQEAVDMLSKFQGSRMEPRLKNHFINMLGPYPVGTTLQLQDGSIVLVTAPNPEIPDRPMAGLIQDSDGNRTESFPVIDLALKDDSDGYIHSIDSPVDPYMFDISPLDILQKNLIRSTEN